MNIRRIIFWLSFVVILGLIVWGLIASMNKKIPTGSRVGNPAPVTAADNITGNLNATTTLIEYSDFQCPACGAYNKVIEQLLASSSSSFRLVYRHYPLPQHPNAMISAQAAEAAGLQGKFWEMSGLIFSNQPEWSDVGDPRSIFEGYAFRIGLNVPKFKVDIESNTVKSKIRSQRDEGQALNVSYTPSFFLNGKIITNPQSYEEFKAIIEAAASGSKN